MLVFGTSAYLHAQRPPSRGTIVIVVPGEARLPIPTLARVRAEQDLSDLMFLRLARLGPTFTTAGDQGFLPELARSWSRRDSLTLVFELDPRAEWQDSTPVTSHDVVFTLTRARDPVLDPAHALLLQYVDRVTAEGDHRVVVHFSRAYAEQFYDATYHVQPLPAHIVSRIPRDSLATSNFVKQPIGSGPYRWVRREPGRSIELAANPRFFLGRPHIGRILILIARDPEAQLNLALEGTVDAIESVSPYGNIPRIAERPEFKIHPVRTFAVGYLLFNQHAYGDTTKPHPILSDVRVRRAILAALDRTAIVKSALGAYGEVAEGPIPRMSWIRDSTAKPTPPNASAAKALLTAVGWTDHDGDGVLDRDGVPLTLRLILPSVSPYRVAIGLLIQEQLRPIGIKVDLIQLDGPVWADRRGRREFDMDLSQGNLDPTPSGLVQSWTCAGQTGSNVGGFCDSRVDSLVAKARFARADPLPLWRQVIRTINDDVPAVFLYTLTNAMALHRRYTNVSIRPESWWGNLWQWSIDPAQAIARDRALTP